MPNQITNPGFELPPSGFTDWQFLDDAERVNAPGDDATGNGFWFARGRVQTTAGPPPPDEEARFGQYFTVVPGEARKLRFKARLTPGGERGNNVGYQVRVFHIFGSPAALLPYDAGIDGFPAATMVVSTANLTDAWQEFESVEVVPLDSTALVVANGYVEPTPPYPIEGLDVDFDDFTFLTDAEYEVMSKRRDIRDAAMTAIGNVTTGNGYAITVNSVRGEYRPYNQVEHWPEVQVTYGSERRRHNELHRKKCMLSLICYIWCKGSATMDPEEECDTVLAEMEKELEKHTAGDHLGLTYVDNVVVGEEIDSFEPDSSVSDEFRLYAVEVIVVYRYTRLNP